MLRKAYAWGMLSLVAAIGLGFQASAQEVCETPQTPRDITAPDGWSTGGILARVPEARDLNLCNLHFHANAEHRGPGFMRKASSGDSRGGYVCNSASSLSASELEPVGRPVCPDHHGKGLKPGDTIEVHWVFTSCDVKTVPNKGLGLCVACGAARLRVESQVFVLVNDDNAINFRKFDLAANTVGGHVQPKSLPGGTGTPVTFMGSTTGPKQANKCDPTIVRWNVRPRCAKLSISSVRSWCENNRYNEDHAHKIRPLVTNSRALSRIAP